MVQLAAARFGRVSVVMMARVSPSKARGENASAEARPGAAFRIRSTGSGTPITPVEQTTTCFIAQPINFAMCRAVAREATMPPGPTEQFAFPELTITARMASDDARTWARERITGGACTRFCVNTAAADAGGSETSKATSSVPVWPRFLRPADAAAKRHPRGRGGKTKSARQLEGGLEVGHSFSITMQDLKFCCSSGLQSLCGNLFRS